jgi:hypothetical protein
MSSARQMLRQTSNRMTGCRKMEDFSTFNLSINLRGKTACCENNFQLINTDSILNSHSFQ